MLDRDTRPASSAIWSPDHVKARLVDAFDLERRLPDNERPHGVGSSWPAAVWHEFGDLIGRSDEARAEVWRIWERAYGPREVSLMWEALDWLKLIRDFPREQRDLKAWAFLKARGISVRDALDRRGLSRATFYRQRDRGAVRIAEQLERTGVVVR
jgi:hypothetical protein